jgi:hypothetical protein
MLLRFFRLSILPLEIGERHVQRLVPELNWMFIDATSANFRLADQQARMRRLGTGSGSTVALVANESINQHFKSHAENFCRW